MNILFIATSSPELSIGGVERHISNLLQFAPHFPSHQFFFLLPKSHKKEIETKGNITIFRKNFLNFKKEKVFGKKQLSKTQTSLKSKQLIQFLNQFLKNQSLDMIISQTGEAYPPQICLSLHMVCLNHHLPLILRAHSFPDTKIKEVFVSDLPWTKIIPVSKSVAGDLLSKDVPIKKISTRYLGVNKKEFNAKLSSKWLKKYLKLPKQSKIILHASRITDGKKPILKEKGLITLIDAFSKIENQNLILILATAIPPKQLMAEYNSSLQQLREIIQLHDLSDRVVIKTFKLNQMPKVYAGSDIFVLASQNETFGQVYLEAMACGTPVIGTNVGGVPEIITDNYNGFLIAPDNSSLLSQKIQDLLYNQELRKNFIKNALKLTNNRLSGFKQFKGFLNYLELQI